MTVSVSDPLPLSDATLDRLPADIARPVYDRAALTPGMVHIGLGNFHRAHQAWYLHRLMQLGAARDWAILGAGVRSYDAAMREKLLAQDCLTTLIELSPDSSGQWVERRFTLLEPEDATTTTTTAVVGGSDDVGANTASSASTGGDYEELDVDVGVDLDLDVSMELDVPRDGR